MTNFPSFNAVIVLLLKFYTIIIATQSFGVNSAGQRFTVVGTLSCGTSRNVNATIVLKYSKNGVILNSQDYPSNSNILLELTKKQPKFVYLQIIPKEMGSGCSKTIQDKVRMREFIPLNSPNRILDVGDCDFATGKCTKFSNEKIKGYVYVTGSIVCSKRPKQKINAQIVLKKKRRGDNVIDSSSYSSAKSPKYSYSVELLKTITTEKHSVFLQIIPIDMPKACRKTIESKVGMREFIDVNGKNTFEVGQCDVGTGKCTKFPFP